jgi:integrase
MRVSARSAFSEGTRKNLQTQWRTFLLFCTYFQFVAVPVDSTTLCLYAQFLSRSLLSVASIRNYVSGVKTMHVYLTLDVSQFDCFQLELVFKGLSRLNPHCPNQALPITPSILLKLHQLCNMSNPEHVTYWCLFLFAFFLMARKSNLVPTVKSRAADEKFIRRKDIIWDDGKLLVQFRWTKTIQFGERILVMPLLSIPNCPLCPVSAFRRMEKLVPGEPGDPAFILPEGCGVVKPLTYGLFMSTLRSWLAAVGEKAEDFSTHSFRRGGATWAFQSGVASELIQLAGDWRSDAYKLYLKFTLQDKIQVSDKMRQHILTQHDLFQEGAAGKQPS